MHLNEEAALSEAGKNRKLMIFDVDGTLVDSQDFIVEAMRRAFAAHDVPMPERKQALSIVGLSLYEAFEVLAGPGAPLTALIETYKEAWTVIRADPDYDDPFYPGARECLDTYAARPNLALGLATGKSRRGVNHLLDRWNLHGHFETIQTSDDHPSKPAPDMILAALAETGVEPNDTLMIGDTAYDMEMALAAGVRAIGVAWGYHDKAMLEAAGAERVIASFTEIEALLD